MGRNSGQEKFDLQSVLRRARASKGAELSPDEIANFTKLCAEIAEVEREVEELQAKEQEAEIERLKDNAQAVIRREVERASKAPNSDERTKDILAERASIKKRLRELGYRINEDGVDNSDLPELVLPFHVWIESWLEENSDDPNIERSLDCYLEQYSLLNPLEGENREYADRRTKCEILKEAVEHVESDHWDTFNDHLRKSQQILLLLDEKKAIEAHLDWSFGQDIDRRESSTDRSTALTTEDQKEICEISATVKEIHLQLKAGTINRKLADKQLEELENRLNQIGIRYSGEPGGFRGFFKKLVKRLKF